MTAQPEWRTGPDPMKCVKCQATEPACDNKRTFAHRHCCEDCDHQPREAA